MRNLYLDLLTRTFSFGNITGRLDAEFKALELVNWEPVHFEARVASSVGEYPRRISQAAVQNISALGGAGAVSAIQCSFLRFFETFGYSALGLSCELESGVCRMGGIENVPQGYVIVKGGGVLAINVLGYNRNVGWRELTAQIRSYCEADVANTYLVYLRFQLMRGVLSQENNIRKPLSYAPRSKSHPSRTGASSCSSGGPDAKCLAF